MSDVKRGCWRYTRRQAWGVDVDVRITRVDYVEAITESVYTAAWRPAQRVAMNCAPPVPPRGRSRADADRRREIIIANAYRDEG